MEPILNDVNWIAVIVSTIVSFGLGWVWYGDKCFGVKWREGIGISPDDTSSMKIAMTAQLMVHSY